jgi:NADH-ubiquinone oxidoreductase chain 4
MRFISLIVYSSIYYREKNYTLKILRFLTTLVALGFFGRVSVVLFYIIYELVIFPVIIIIYLFGSQPEKINSIYYAVIYTGGLSLPFLYEVVRLEGWLVDIYLSPIQQMVIVGLFLRKRPIYFLHVWLPKTHVEAPTSARILLAGILLKVGVYGFIKMVVLFNIIMVIVVFIRLIGLLFMPVVTCVRVERKVITACRRVTHINLVVYGINILSNVGIRGSYLLSLSHGFVSSLIFSFVGIIYRNNGTRVIFFLRRVRSWSLLFGAMVGGVYLANAGTPPFMSFWGELLVLIRALRGSSLLVRILIGSLLYSFYFSIYMLIHFRKIGQRVRVESRMLITLFVGVLLVRLFIIFII